MKWLKNNEVNKSGHYLFIRIDDYDTDVGIPARVIEFDGKFYLHEYSKVNFSTSILEFDDQCRWLGPIERPEKDC